MDASEEVTLSKAEFVQLLQDGQVFEIIAKSSAALVGLLIHIRDGNTIAVFGEEAVISHLDLGESTLLDPSP